MPIHPGTFGVFLSISVTEVFFSILLGIDSLYIVTVVTVIYTSFSVREE